jgi:hypothetical protein
VMSLTFADLCRGAIAVAVWVIVLFGIDLV